MGESVERMIDSSYYNGRDTYSDGDIENEMLAAAREHRIDAMLRSDNRWPILYHFIDARENLLSWIPFTKDDSVLEIGCGCGALTGLFCRKAGHVEAVEISPRRAEIAAHRNLDHPNLTIHIGNLNDMKFNHKFDYVTLIGVLEYAGQFTHTRDPHRDFLNSCKRFLKPGGKLIIAIENRFGMKYWSGAKEDHTQIFFDGILNYPPEHRGGVNRA